jgi:hypothetical protein
MEAMIDGSCGARTDVALDDVGHLVDNGRRLLRLFTGLKKVVTENAE